MSECSNLLLSQLSLQSVLPLQRLHHDRLPPSLQVDRQQLQGLSVLLRIWAHLSHGARLLCGGDCSKRFKFFKSNCKHWHQYSVYHLVRLICDAQNLIFKVFKNKILSVFSPYNLPIYRQFAVIYFVFAFTHLALLQQLLAELQDRGDSTPSGLYVRAQGLQVNMEERDKRKKQLRWTTTITEFKFTKPLQNACKSIKIKK